MLSVERVKELINDPNLSDKEIEEIRDHMYMLTELMFEQWMEDRKKEREKRSKTIKKIKPYEHIQRKTRRIEANFQKRFQSRS